MTWLQIILYGYLAGMLHFILTIADQAHDDTDDDPLTVLLRHNRILRAVAALAVIVLSPLWPINVVAAMYRWARAVWCNRPRGMRRYASNNRSG